MGKKLYGKKHRGVKDPQQQRLAREELVKNKINCKPSDIDDDQPIPESLHNLIKLKKLAEDQDMMKKRKKHKAKGLVDSRLMTDAEETLRGMTVPEAPVPAFIQQPGESQSKFLQRVDRICDRVVIDAGYTNKHKMDSATNAGSDEDEDAPKNKRAKKERGNIEELMRSDEGRKMKQKKVREGELTKKEKLRARALNKKMAKQNKVEEKMQERNRFRDNVAFGEIVHAPPVLNIPARNQAKKPIETKPGKRGLLLNHILLPDKVSNSAKPKPGGAKKSKAKSLPAAERERIEKNRIIAVEAYRRLKLTQGK